MKGEESRKDAARTIVEYVERTTWRERVNDALELGPLVVLALLWVGFLLADRVKEVFGTDV